MADEKKPQGSLALLKNNNLMDRLTKIKPPDMDLTKQMEFAFALARVLDAKKDVTARSIVGCMYVATSLGLSLNEAKGEAYLVPFKKKCTLIPGYRGLVKLMRNAGVKDIRGRIVWAKDDFDYWEDASGTQLKYKPVNDPERGKEEWGLSIAVLPDGTRSVLVIPYHKIEVIRNIAIARTPKGPWKDWPEEMAQKTCIRFHSKTLPSDDNLSVGVRLDEKVEIDDASPVGAHEMEDIFGPDTDIEDGEFSEELPGSVEEKSTIMQKVNAGKAFLGKEEWGALLEVAETKNKTALKDFTEPQLQELCNALQRKLDS